MALQTLKMHYSGSKEVFHKKSIKNPNIEADFLFYKFFYTFCIRGSQDVQLGLKVNIDLHGTENVLKKRYTSSKEVPYEKSIENPNLEVLLLFTEYSTDFVIDIVTQTLHSMPLRTF